MSKIFRLVFFAATVCIFFSVLSISVAIAMSENELLTELGLKSMIDYKKHHIEKIECIKRHEKLFLEITKAPMIFGRIDEWKKEAEKDPEIVPSLLFMLEGSGGRFTKRDSAVLLLGRIGDNRATERLLFWLDNDSGPIIEDFIEALGDIGDPRAADKLIEIYKDDDEDTVEAAIFALARIETPETEQVAKEVATSGKFDNKYKVVCASLRRIAKGNNSPIIKEVLIGNRFKDNSKILCCGLEIMGDHKIDGAFDIAVDFINSGVRDQEMCAVKIMKMSKNKKATKHLIKLLKRIDNRKDENTDYELEVVFHALSALKDKTATEPLLKYISKDNSYYVRAIALTTLFSIGDEKAIPHIRKYAEDKSDDDRIRESAIYLLKQYDLTK